MFRASSLWRLRRFIVPMLFVGGLLPVAASASKAALAEFLHVAPDDGVIEKRLAADVGFREVVGFRADQGYVRDLIERDQTGDPSVETVLGTSVTGDEAQELRTRLRLQNEIQSIVNYGENWHPDTYAGIYIDHEDGGIAVALFTGDMTAHLERLGTFPMPNRLRFGAARWSLAQLHLALSRINSNIRPLGAQGIFVTSAGIDVQRNVVRVGLREVTAEAKLHFDTFYEPGMIELSQSDYGRLVATIPGGAPIDNITRGGGCTAGFSYRNSTNDYGFFTAGHCGLQQGDQFRSVWYPNQTYQEFGSVVGGTGPPTENTDSTVIPAPAADTTNQSGWVIINRAAGLHDDQIGVILCGYGGETGTQLCGTVVSKTFTSNACGGLWGCTTVRDTRLMDMGCNNGIGNGPVPGDSGGPVYSGDGGAFGLIRAFFDGVCPRQYLNYTHVQWAMQQWGVTLPR